MSPGSAQLGAAAALGMEPFPRVSGGGRFPSSFLFGNLFFPSAATCFSPLYCERLCPAERRPEKSLGNQTPVGSPRRSQQRSRAAEPDGSAGTGARRSLLPLPQDRGAWCFSFWFSHRGFSLRSGPKSHAKSRFPAPGALQRGVQSVRSCRNEAASPKPLVARDLGRRDQRSPSQRGGMQAVKAAGCKG